MNRQVPGKALEILQVEDNPGDVRLTQEALQEAPIRPQLHVAPDGVEALGFLRRQGRHASAPRPDLILLDLNLPKLNGHEFLEKIKQDADLKRIPVVILTTSRADEDVLRCYNSHANCYITKPVDLDQFIRVMRSVEEFWLNIVKLPPEENK